jgi:hypothetical protein
MALAAVKRRMRSHMKIAAAYRSPFAAPPVLPHPSVDGTGKYAKELHI